MAVPRRQTVRIDHHRLAGVEEVADDAAVEEIVDAAARLYFGKSARAVTLYESALLAGLLKAPSRLRL